MTEPMTEPMTTTGAVGPDGRVRGAAGQGAGTPPPRVRRGLVAGVIALAVAVGGGVVHATSGSSEASSAIGQAPDGGGFGGSGGGMGGGAAVDALHGEYVVSDGDGGYATRVVQTGTITAISGTSVTAASPDGYARTYVIDAETVFGAMTGPGGAGGQGGPGDSGGTAGSGAAADASSTGSAADLAAGDEITVVATASGDTATATRVSERAAR
ncbi:hypothetical protein [Actinosynnema pretiosum]|uniref:DUF5666 domain-containing protein n=1 Tax=Actinosynnema pretiosum TaxID=42197 RepID=A0A290Z7Z5_9PSEU|nr:hypothetical protein [Actinosynnema pretiosum]ATE55114.1 hypothetical protein CNX65_18995 [Actinosynnema pretiosum]